MSGQVAQDRQFVKVGELARVLGVNEATVRRAIHDGEIRALRLRGQYLIPHKVLDELLVSGRSPTPS